MARRSPYTGPYARESAYRSALAQRHRDTIFSIIGRECEECGATGALEVNHVYRRDWHPRRMSVYRRNLRYLRELSEGVPLTPLCPDCNARYRPLPVPTHGAVIDQDQPF